MSQGSVAFILLLLLLAKNLNVGHGYCHRSRWGTVSCCTKFKIPTDNGLIGSDRRRVRSMHSFASIVKSTNDVTATLDVNIPLEDPFPSAKGPLGPSSGDDGLKVRSCDTIHHVKKRFEASYQLAIAPHYRTFILDLLAFTHIQRQQATFQYDAIYALGLCTQFYSAMRHYALPQEIDSIFNAMLAALQFDPQQIRGDAKRLISQAKDCTPVNDNLPPAELFGLLDVGRLSNKNDFAFSDAWAVGLGRLIELCGAIPSDAVFHQWNQRGISGTRLMSAWSDFQADAQRLLNLENLQQQLLRSQTSFWSSPPAIPRSVLFHDDRLQALRQLNANISVHP